MAKGYSPEKLLHKQNEERMNGIMESLMKVLQNEKLNIFEMMDACQNLQRFCNSEVVRVLKERENVKKPDEQN